MDFSKLNEVERSSLIRNLQKELNLELGSFLEESEANGQEFLARALIKKVEVIIDRLNSQGYNFGRIEYSGDINYENSEQWFSNGSVMGTGIVLHFHGFSVQVSWEDDQAASALDSPAPSALTGAGETGSKSSASETSKSLPLTWFLVILIFSIIIGYFYGVWWIFILFVIYLLTGVVSVAVRWWLENRNKNN